MPVQTLIDRPECHCLLITLTALLFVWCLGAVVWMYITFAPVAACTQSIAFITISLILGFLVTLLSLAPKALHSAGLMTSMLVCSYAVWLCAAALMSAPTNTKCSRLVNMGSPGWLTVRRCTRGVRASPCPFAHECPCT
jgi:Serine incorporator (Serinc)